MYTEETDEKVSHCAQTKHMNKNKSTRNRTQFRFIIKYLFNVLDRILFIDE